MSLPQPPYHPREPVNPRFHVSFHHLRDIALEEANFGKELEDQEGLIQRKGVDPRSTSVCVHLGGNKLLSSLLCI